MRIKFNQSHFANPLPFVSMPAGFVAGGGRGWGRYTSPSPSLQRRGIITFICGLVFLVITGCSTSTIFQPLGSNISSPNGIAIDATANRLYLVNSNSNVLYDWTQGSVQILDLTDPLHPKLMNTIATQSFSGEDVIDSNGRKLLYTTNRYSEQTTVTQDHLLIMNIDESSADFTTVSSVLTAKDPYGLFCCYPADRMWIATEGNELDFIDLATQTVGSVNLLQPISNGGTFSQSQTSFIAIKGNQAFLQRFNGGILILNLDTAADPTKNPIDYWIEDINNPTGVATDSTYLYVADQETIDGNWTPLLLVVDLSKLPPLTDNALTQVKQRDVDGLVVNQIQVARNPQRVFLTSQYAFVTCNDSDDQGFVSVIDLATKTRVTDIQVGKQPFGMALYAPGGVEKYLYVGNVESNTLSIIDIASLTVVGTYP